MLNPRLAGRYAKSLIDIAVERNQLEEVFGDMKFFKQIMKTSRDFLVLLRSPVVPADKKSKVMAAITNGKTNVLTDAFTNLLIAKKREFFFPEIVDAFIDQYNVINNIQRVRLTTATPVSDDVKNAIVGKLKGETELGNIELEAVVKEDIIGGFVLEFNNQVVDASVVRELRELRNQFMQNIYVQQIR